MNRYKIDRALGLTILVTVLFMVGVSYHYDNQHRKIVNCQTSVNQEFFRAIKNNAEAGGKDRKNLADTKQREAEALENMLRAAGDPSKVRVAFLEYKGAIEDFNKKRLEIDELRSQFPPLPESICQP